MLNIKYVKQYLNIEYIVKLDDRYIFTFDKLTKTGRKGRPPLSKLKTVCSTGHHLLSASIAKAVG